MIIDASSYEHEPTPWAPTAACANHTTPELWFPTRGEPTAPAVAICADCPARLDCLAYALRWRIDHGIWGGLTGRQRQRLYPGANRAKKTAAPHATTTRYARGCRCDGCRTANHEYQSGRLQRTSR